ncbi:MAG TPA: ATP-binding protein [Acidimicrobiales bacterium]|nr:ATP-binding protein [Acidimicrobiales bacterium]
MPDALTGRRLSQRWVDRSIRTKGLVVVVVPVAILFAVLGSTLWFIHVNNDAQNAEQNARQCADTATALDNTLLSAQTAIRGYFLTGDRVFKASYDQAQNAMPAQLGLMNHMTATGGCEPQWARAVARDGQRITIDMTELSSLPPGLAASQAVLRLSQDATNQMHADVSSLARLESNVVANQRSAVHSSNVGLLAVAIVAVVLAVTGGVLVSRLFTRGVVSRLRRLERATSDVERGEPPREVPTGNDEIGRLAARMMTTSAQLVERAEERDRARSDLEHILTASPVVSLRYDVAGRRFSYASPNIERMLGITAEEATANPRAIDDRFHPDSRRELRDALVSGAGQRGDHLQIVLRFRRDSTSEDWKEAEAVYTVDTAPDGALRNVVAYLIDVSERNAARHAAEERRQLLESIFHASPDTIVVRDIDGRVVLASSELVQAVGASADDVDVVIDRAFRFGRVPVSERVLLDSLTTRCVAGERTPEPVITSGRLPNGEVLTYETRARPVFDESGTVTGTVTVSRDVTRRVGLEQSLRQATELAERASDAKSEFLSRMSHELRTPLNAILGFAQLLELDDLTEDQSASVDQIHVAGRHLLALINEVLDISRIEAGHLSLSPEPVAVTDVLEEVSTLLQPEADEAGVSLRVDAPRTDELFVRADRQRLLQVLLNLGTNALKYNLPGGSAWFRTARRAGGRVRFEVQDTGRGIPRDQQDQLFVPFARLGAEASPVEGTGVGLALSKQLVEAMGGTIGVISRQDQGSTFWVELHGTEASAADGATRREPAGARRDGAPGARHDRADISEHPRAGMVVLHIEDNPSNASLVEQLFARRHHVRLVRADTARTGLELARRHRPDLVLLDLHLPDLRGDEVLQRLKALPDLAETKIVVVSADATPSRVKHMLDLGVEGYLTKPVDVDALLRLVDDEVRVDSGAGR